MESKDRDSRLFASILSAITDGVLATDRTGKVTFLNRTAETLIGMGAGDACGMHLKDVLLLSDPATGKPHRIPAVRSLRTAGAGHEHQRVFCTGASGDKELVDVLFRPILGVRGRVDGIIAVVRNVSGMVARESAALDQQRIEAIGAMAAGIAREFSDYLGAISGHAFAITDNLLPNTRAHEDASKILETASYASGLTKRLNSIAAASRSEPEAAPGPVDLQKTISEAVEILETGFAQQGISFKLPGAERTPYATADPHQLLDCLLNIFMNAAAAMPDGGTITVDCSRKRVSDDDFTVLRIRDTGCGMSNEILDRVFEPFFSAGNSKGATGLGLTVVKNSVKGWGGSVRLRSRPGHGTSCRIFMKTADSPLIKKRRAPAGGEALLVLDHRPDDRNLAGEILRSAGYTVHIAAGAAECIKLFEEHSMDIKVSIVDVFMPGAAGKTVLEKITELDPTAQIVMTSGFSRDYIRTYLDHGAWEFLQKPLDSEQLLACVKRALNKSASLQEKGATA